MTTIHQTLEAVPLFATLLHLELGKEEPVALLLQVEEHTSAGELRQH